MLPVNSFPVTVVKSVSSGFLPDGMVMNIPCGAISLGSENLSKINQQDDCSRGLTRPGEHVPDVFPDSVMTVKIQGETEALWVTQASFDAYVVKCNACCTAIPQLATPANFTATNGNAQSVINWDDVTNATGYVLERSLSNAFTSPTVIYTGTVSGYTDTGRTNGTTYYYRVRATAPQYSDSGYAYTNATPSLPQLATPQAFVGTPGSLQAILDWADVASATGYVVDMASDSGFTAPTQIYSGATSAYTKTALTAATVYYFRVKAQATGFLDSAYAYVNVTPTA